MNNPTTSDYESDLTDWFQVLKQTTFAQQVWAFMKSCVRLKTQGEFKLENKRLNCIPNCW